MSNVLNCEKKYIENLLETNLFNIHNKSMNAKNECTISFLLESIEWIFNYVKSCLLMIETLDK